METPTEAKKKETFEEYHQRLKDEKKRIAEKRLMKKKHPAQPSAKKKKNKGNNRYSVLRKMVETSEKKKIIGEFQCTLCGQTHLTGYSYFEGEKEEKLCDFCIIKLREKSKTHGIRSNSVWTISTAFETNRKKH